MPQINFYHLTKLPVEKALPKLLEKVVTSGLKTILQAPNEERVEFFNKVLWTYTTKFFLPHGSKSNGYPEKQPIYLTSDNDNPNGASVIALVDEVNFDRLKQFDKCIYMFDGQDSEQLARARSYWKEAKNLDYELTYWQQNAKGGWEKGQ